MEPSATRQDPGAASRLRSEHELRAERTAALARRGIRASNIDAGLDHLVCACGSERYGLPLKAVAQVLPMRPLTPMPGAVPSLIGLIALSGRIVGVLGLARALGRPESAGEPGHVVVLRGTPAHQPLALAVDRVLGIAPAAATSATNPGGLGNEVASGYAPGVAGADRPDFVIIDLPRLLRRALP
ncbi:chemotaxis protein CheW [Methylobacterium sp. J-088]|uniref:chemotaxis protein CheW n=1 Tax=Methylobacterium sp. J-088 TaxID=2836664 RepID=UPI001FBA7E03|nr:chemotaxis protein CheW [Methylobacterium sp. J-088]MCJ2061685.1 chemotaxis protein CheW [Methylobacterium sp. J-088]